MKRAERERNYRFTSNRKPVIFGVKITCKVCGKQRDQYHRDDLCEAAWVLKCDEEAARAKQGGQP